MQFQIAYKETVELVMMIMSDLLVADKYLGLFSLSDAKTKSAV